MIAQKSIQDVLYAARIEEVIGEYVNLKRRGVNRIGLCPFHDEKTPSFIVSPTKNIYKCFGCGKAGNASQFLMEYEKMNFVEAIRTLAAKYNIQLEETNQNPEEYLEERKHIDSLYLVNDFAYEYFQKQLLETDEGRNIGLSYFKERGYLEATIKKFGLGYAPKSRTHFYENALDAKYKEEYLRELGLISESKKDFFNGRVMFSIQNLSGKNIAFAGRILGSNPKAPKYINSPESAVYNKRKILYGLYQAKTAIRKSDYCILVEGYTDVISMSQQGVENVVASSGTALTTGQLNLIKRFTDNLTILYDGDKAGIKAALRGMDLALEVDLNPKIALLPNDHDPDSYIKEVGHDAFLEYLDQNSKDFILFKIDLQMEEAINDPIKKSNLIREVVESISKIRDRIKRSTYIQQSSLLLGIDERIIIKETNSIIRNNLKKKRREKERAQLEETGYRGSEEDFINEKPDQSLHNQVEKKIEAVDAYQERDLARIIIAHGNETIKDEDGNMSVAEYIYGNIVDVIEYFDNKIYQQMIIEGFQESQRGNYKGAEYFTNHTDEKLRDAAIELVATPYVYAKWDEKGIFLQTQKRPEENFSDDSFQAIIRFKFRKIKRIMASMKQKIDSISQNGDPDELRHYLKAYRKLQEEKLSMADQLGIIVG